MLWACHPVAVWSSSIVAPSGAVRSSRHCMILVVFARGAGVSLAMLADDLADLPRVDVLPAADTLLNFIAFAVLVLEFVVFFMVWNSVVLNTALIAAFAPP